MDLGFHHGSQLVMQCVTTAHFSIAVNEELSGYFPSLRGFRQGDPLSPFLFVLAMEVLSGVLRETANNPRFSFH